MNEASQKKSLVRTASRVLLGRGSIAIVSLAFWAFLARSLPKTTMGVIAVHAIIVMSTKVFLELGLPYLVIREATPLVREGDERGAVERVIGVSTFLRVIASVVFCALYGATGFLLTGLLEHAFPGLDVRYLFVCAGAHLLGKSLQYV